MADSTGQFAIRRAPFDSLQLQDLYDILRLRSEVFVVEQTCVFLDIDGRDTEPGAEQFWVRDEAGVVATLRILDEGDGVWSIGRVIARPDARGSGIASRLVAEALDVLRGDARQSVIIGAQTHLATWYGRFGFIVSGPEYVEDDIPHVPMRLELP